MESNYNLSIIFNDDFILDDPFMIASSHWTSEEKLYSIYEKIIPSAITLKTCSQEYGGDGIGSRKWTELETYKKNELGRYVDGAKTLELWDIATTYQMSNVAEETLDETTKIGLSILQGEDYQKISKTLDLKKFSFIELNWKYTFRDNKEENLETIIADLNLFLDIFKDLKCFVKLPRETISSFALIKLLPVFEIMFKKNIILIIANSKKIQIPLSRATNRKDNKDIENGVLIGDYLFLETYDTIKKLNNLKKENHKIPEIVASGGIMDISSFIDCIHAGAKAVQLCTIFDRKGILYLETLREQLYELINNNKLKSFLELCDILQNNKEKSIKIIDQAKMLSKSKSLIDDEKSREILKKAILKQLNFDGENIINEEIELSETLKVLTSLVKKGINMQVNNKKNSARGYKLIVPKSNLASYLLSELCKNRYFLNYQEVETIDNLKDTFKNKNFSYDLAIITRAELEYLQKDGENNLKENYPIEIGIVGKSIVDIVGNKNDKLNDIETIYHFGGISSRDTTTMLLMKLENKPNLIQILKRDVKVTLPLILTFWRPDEKLVIITGTPLGDFYSYFLNSSKQEYWGTIESKESDLVLIMSKSFKNSKDSADGKLSSTFLKIMKGLNAEIRENVDFYVDDLINKGILNFISRLIQIN